MQISSGGSERDRKREREREPVKGSLKSLHVSCVQSYAPFVFTFEEIDE